MFNLNHLRKSYRDRIQVDSGTGCWLWSGAKSSTGRGCVCLCGHTVSTHRLFFELFIGPIPKGMELHHKCEVPHCCNPDHLEIKTRLQHRRIHPRRYANAEKTQCKNGHPFNQENTYLELRYGWRRRHCKLCRLDAVNRHYAKKKGLTHG